VHAEDHKKNTRRTFKNRMKILIVHNFYRQKNVGGEDIVAKTEFVRLREVFGSQNVVEFAVYSDDANILRMIFSPFFPLLTMAKLFYVIKKKGIKTVHVHNYFPLISPLCFVISKLAGAQVVHTLHNFRPWCIAGTFYRNGKGICMDCLEKNRFQGVKHKCFRSSFFQSFHVYLCFTVYHKLRMFNVIDKFFTVSDFQNRLVKSLQFNTNKVSTKRNLLSFKTIKRPLEASEARDGFIFVGRLEESKGIEVLLKAWEGVPESINLIIIGLGKDIGNLRRIYERENVRFLGRLENTEVMKHISASKFLIQSSLWYETMGLTVVEAFSCGTPVIGFSIGTRMELITHMDNGLLCDIDHFSQSIITANNLSPDRYRHMQSAALRSYEKYMEQSVKDTLERYK
jgi:glycosyltransferase involved in cell wall biosynthesis